MNAFVDKFMQAIRFESPREISIVFWAAAPFCTRLVGVKEIEYYKNIELKTETQHKMFSLFPESVFLPGFWPDYGATSIPSAFGSKIIWQDTEAPYAKPCLTSIDQVDHLKPANPYEDGLLKTCLQEWEYYWRHVDRRWIDEYGYLDGVGFIMGPVESAAQLRGYTDFFIDLMEEPEKVHKLLDIVTETEIRYLKAQEKINGKLKRVCIGDHLATQISPAHCREFFIPYLKRIFDEFSYAEVRAWHNEGHSGHIADIIPDMNCNIWHFGEDAAGPTQAALKGKVVLMGNIHPVDHLLMGDTELVRQVTRDLLSEIVVEDGFFVSSGGGMAPGTPIENVRALIDTAMAFNRSLDNA